MSGDSPPNSPDPLVGEMIGKFRVEGLLGSGGMGVVYLGVHPLINAKAAIKVLRPGAEGESEQAERFVREAKALSALSHDRIVKVMDFGNLADGRQYMVMEYLDSESLEAVISREAPMPVTMVLPLLDQMLEALAFAHSAGIIHRDLKPSNVSVLKSATGAPRLERKLKLIDFGLAKTNAVAFPSLADGPLIKASMTAGTPEYIAPEQARGLMPSAATDLYCLGVIAFEMLTGQLPFKAQTVLEMLEAHVNTPAPRVSSRVENVPPELDDLVGQLLSKDPADRGAPAERIRRIVQRLIRELREQDTVMRRNPLVPEPKPSAPGFDPRLSETAKVLRRPKKIARWVLAALILALMLGGWLIFGRPEQPVAVDAPATPTAPSMIVTDVDRAPTLAPITVAEAQPTKPVVAPDPTLTALTPSHRMKLPEVEPVRLLVPVGSEPSHPETNAEAVRGPCADVESWRAPTLDRIDALTTRLRASMAASGASELEIEQAVRSAGPLSLKVQSAKDGRACQEAVRSLDAWLTEHGL